jgi:hypothetical protein
VGLRRSTPFNCRGQLLHTDLFIYLFQCVYHQLYPIIVMMIEFELHSRKRKYYFCSPVNVRCLVCSPRPWGRRSSRGCRPLTQTTGLTGRSGGREGGWGSVQCRGTCSAVVPAVQSYLQCSDTCSAEVPAIQWYLQCSGICSAMVPAVQRYLQCRGTCSAEVPAVPWYLQCRGTCSAEVPAVQKYLQCRGTCDTVVPSVQWYLQCSGTCSAVVPAVQWYLQCSGTCSAVVQPRLRLAGTQLYQVQGGPRTDTVPWGWRSPTYHTSRYSPPSTTRPPGYWYSTSRPRWVGYLMWDT